MPVARMAPEEYERLPLIAVAALVGEWRQAYEHAAATEVGALKLLEVLSHLGDAVEAWRRKRDLPLHTHSSALVADARAYATAHPGELASFDQAVAGVRAFLGKVGE